MPAFVFPGQGSQRPGMGQPWRDHPSWDVVADASEVAGRNLAHLLLNAGPDELTETRNAQLATFTFSLIVLDAVERLGIEPTACAGHSLGEYSALVAAGALSFDDGVAIVAERGEAMQAAADERPGTMKVIVGLDDDSVDMACYRADAEVWVANYNAPDNVVIAGDHESVESALDEAFVMGAQRVIPVAVGGAFHTPFMASARPRLRKALRAATFREPEVPVVANVDALPHKTADDWQGLSSAQLCSPVRWRQSVLRLAGLPGLHSGFPGLTGTSSAPSTTSTASTTSGTSTTSGASTTTATTPSDGERLFVELGSGGVLTGLTRRIVPGATAISVSTPADLDMLVEAISGHSALHTYAVSHHGEHLYVSERMVISPCAGVFEPTGASAAAAAEGEPIEVGTVLGRVGGTDVRSPFAGWLMGMLALPGERVQSGQPVAWLRAG
ncbi:MAG: [acyl-carrier-protein] S-malonyltransferase [Acidimicrobiaceae bacterium]|nr:[acyl-carrier-protein] S-malonyltransferase [Acidimicrobiaceae bacterium]